MIIKQHRIYRIDLQNNPDVLYLFGDNDERNGYGGQAGQMRDEENGIGIRTKWKPDNRAASFFSDNDFDLVIGMMNADLEPVREHLRQGKLVVIPADGLGTGLSELPIRAPEINFWLEEALAELAKIEAE